LRRAPYRVDWVYGTFMAVRRDLFRQLGGFDPRYFIYGEDLDLCYRAARLGSRTIHVPAARAVHGTSLGTNVSAGQRFGLGREAEVVKGEMRFYAARGAPRDLVLFRAVAACKFGLKAALAAAIGRRGAADGIGPAPLPPADAPLTVAALLVGRAGKPLAWNVLRQHARAPVAIFFDADVWFAPDAFRLLLGALAAAPSAGLASGKTICAPRPRPFERIMAAPYGVDFPNLSAQLYAARLGALPPAM